MRSFTPRSERSLSDDLGALSPREREVVEFATQGRTDEQIARLLGLSTSTVNSYWVRIRGKLGPHSRTEIVATVLREGFRQETAGLRRGLASATASARHAEDGLAQSRADLRATEGGLWHLSALDCLPAAVLVLSPPDLIAYANRQAHRLLGAEPGALEGASIWDTTVSPYRDELERAAHGFYVLEMGEAMELGLEGPYYARRADGSSFRAVLVGAPFETPEGRMACVTIREFGTDVEALMRETRRPAR